MHRTVLCVSQVPTYDLHEVFSEPLRLFAASSGFKVIACDLALAHSARGNVSYDLQQHCRHILAVARHYLDHSLCLLNLQRSDTSSGEA